MKKTLATAIGMVMLTAAAPAAADPNLVGQWHLDEGQGLTTSDSSGQSNEGALQGGVAWVAGRFGSALQFDGSTGELRVADNLALEPTAGITVSAWVKSAGSPGNFRYVVAKGAANCSAASYGIYTGASGGLQFYVSMNHAASFVRSPDAGSVIWDGAWHMVVGAYDGSDVRLYVDGAEVGHGVVHTGPLAYTLPDSNDFYIGNYPGCNLRNFSGAIDEVAVWRVALSAAQIQTAYRGDSPPTSPSGPTSGGGSTSSPQGGSPGSAPGSPARPPAIKSLKLAPSAFALITRRGPRSRGSLGTTISYLDSQAARSSFVVLRHSTGIKVGKRCVAGAGRAHSRARGCVLYTPIGGFVHTDIAGRNSFRFSGIRGHKLTPGTYRFAVTPRAGKMTGPTVTVTFTIVS